MGEQPYCWEQRVATGGGVAGRAVCGLKERCDGREGRNRELTAQGAN